MLPYQRQGQVGTPGIEPRPHVLQTYVPTNLHHVPIWGIRRFPSRICRIWTYDPSAPNGVRYQTALISDKCFIRSNSPDWIRTSDKRINSPRFYRWTTGDYKYPQLRGRSVDGHRTRKISILKGWWLYQFVYYAKRREQESNLRGFNTRQFSRLLPRPTGLSP